MRHHASRSGIILSGKHNTRADLEKKVSVFSQQQQNLIIYVQGIVYSITG
jgi:hypothetical protein